MIFWFLVICVLGLHYSSQLAEMITSTFGAVATRSLEDESKELVNRIWFLKLILVIFLVFLGVPAGIVFILIMTWSSMPFTYVIGTFLTLVVWITVPLIKFLTPRPAKREETKTVSNAAIGTASGLAKSAQ
jgi:hypothetical protein